VEGSEIDHGELTVKMNSGASRSHQFLITMERALEGASKVETPFIAFKNTQRETGEVLVEGVGAMDLTAKEGGGLKRMDAKETNPYLRSLARFPLQAAFRFHRQPNETPALALDWTRFPDSTVLAAVAERAVVTTLVTNEGRSLTEVKLTVKNQAQPFLKVGLPKDATIVSADVAGEKVKPVEGVDGNRVPLLRDRFRPTAAYEVSFVFMHSGAPFAKKGGSELALPAMDIPINVLEWEVYLPEQYKVKDFGGDALAMNLLPAGMPVITAEQVMDLPLNNRNYNQLTQLSPGVIGNTLQLGFGQIGGVITDPTGAVISNAQVKVTTKSGTNTVTTDSNGNWVANGVPSGNLKIEASAPGFQKQVYNNTPYDASQPSQYAFQLSVGTVTETVTVTAAAPMVETTTAQTKSHGRGHRDEDKDRLSGNERNDAAQQAASANVFNLQKKVAGVLPVRVDVPRAGASYRFARALVLDEETKVTFNYRTK
jgi:hypothetical protein